MLIAGLRGPCEAGIDSVQFLPKAAVEPLSAHVLFTMGEVSLHDVHMPILAVGGHVQSPELQIWCGWDQDCKGSELYNAVYTLDVVAKVANLSNEISS